MTKITYIITPSYLIKKKKDFTGGIKNLNKLGFKILNENFIKKLPTEKEKAKQIHMAFLNNKIEFILAQRGGYSSIKVLPYINYTLIKNHPKLFAGFSDLSTLLNTIYEKTGLVTLHSPMVINFSKPTKFTVKSFLNAVNNFPVKNLLHNAPVKIFKSGIAKGTLKGGNLITLTSLIGTKWEIKTDESIVFLEEVDEKLYEVDRSLTQWILRGKFKKIRGLVLGNFRKININDVYKILKSQMKFKFPVLHCPFIGHVDNKITLPVGALVELNTYKGTLVVK